MLAAGVVAGLVRRHFWEGWVMRKRGKRVPRLLVDLSGVVLVGGALVYVAESVYGADLSALKLGSTVSVAVLGFASQDLLGNLLSGMALQMASPFKPGDWLLLDGRRLQVVEVNWRSTRMRSPDNILVEVPNKTVAGGVITNLSAPTEERATTVGVVVESGAPPREVKACLAEAVSRVEGVMAEPPVRVNVKEFLEAGVSYEVVFWVRGEEVLGEVSDAVRVAVWYGLREGGFRMAYPGRRLWIEGGAGGLGIQEGRFRKE
jgi:small-conductance mechanosensitive channel